MAKKDRNENEIEKVDPSFLLQYVEEDHSLDSMKVHVTVPRFKIIQAMTDKALKKQFGEGTAIIRPGDVFMCRHEGEGLDGKFKFVPLFFFSEYCKWAVLGESPAVVSSSYSVTSHEAKCSVDPKKRYEVYEEDEHLEDGDKKKRRYRYVSHLRFIGMIYGDHQMAGTPVTLSFERGEFGRGKNFINSINMRRQIINDTPRKVPLWAQVWEFSVGFREKESKSWYGFDAVAPEGRSIILQDESEKFHEMHVDFGSAFEEKRLIIDDDDSGIEPDEAQASGDF